MLHPLQKLMEHERRCVEFQDFKRQVCCNLIEEQKKRYLTVVHSSITPNKRKAPPTATASYAKSSSMHVLVPTLKAKGRRNRLQCRLCSLLKAEGYKNGVSLCCVECKMAFHVECFCVWHNPEGLKSLGMNELYDEVMNAKDEYMSPLRRTRNANEPNVGKSSKTIPEITEDYFPFAKKAKKTTEQSADEEDDGNKKPAAQPEQQLRYATVPSIPYSVKVAASVNADSQYTAAAACLPTDDLDEENDDELSKCSI